MDVRIETTREIERALTQVRERISDNVKNRLPTKTLACRHCYNVGKQSYVITRTSITSHCKLPPHRLQIENKRTQICLCGRYFWADGPLDEIFFLRHLYTCLLIRPLPNGVSGRIGDIVSNIIAINSTEPFHRRINFLRETPFPDALPPVEQSKPFQLEPNQNDFYLPPMEIYDILAQSLFNRSDQTTSESAMAATAGPSGHSSRFHSSIDTYGDQLDSNISDGSNTIDFTDKTNRKMNRFYGLSGDQTKSMDQSIYRNAPASDISSFMSMTMEIPTQLESIPVDVPAGQTVQTNAQTGPTNPTDPTTQTALTTQTIQTEQTHKTNLTGQSVPTLQLEQMDQLGQHHQLGQVGDQTTQLGHFSQLNQFSQSVKVGQDSQTAVNFSNYQDYQYQFAQPHQSQTEYLPPYQPDFYKPYQPEGNEQIDLNENCGERNDLEKREETEQDEEAEQDEEEVEDEEDEEVEQDEVEQDEKAEQDEDREDEEHERGNSKHKRPSTLRGTNGKDVQDVQDDQEDQEFQDELEDQNDQDELVEDDRDEQDGLREKGNTHKYQNDDELNIDYLKKPASNADNCTDLNNSSLNNSSLNNNSNNDQKKQNRKRNPTKTTPKSKQTKKSTDSIKPTKQNKSSKPEKTIRSQKQKKTIERTACAIEGHNTNNTDNNDQRDDNKVGYDNIDKNRDDDIWAEYIDPDLLPFMSAEERAKYPAVSHLAPPPSPNDITFKELDADRRLKPDYLQHAVGATLDASLNQSLKQNLNTHEATNNTDDTNDVNEADDTTDTNADNTAFTTETEPHYDIYDAQYDAIESELANATNPDLVECDKNTGVVISQHDKQILLKQVPHSVRPSSFFEMLAKLLNKPDVSKANTMKLDLLRLKYVSDRSVTTRTYDMERRRIFKRFKRFFLNYLKETKCVKITCNLCNPPTDINAAALLEHNKSHLMSYSTKEIRCCCICKTYFFLHGPAHYYHPHYYEHLCRCATGTSFIKNSRIMSTFMDLCAACNMEFDPNDQLCKLYENKNIEYTPSLEDWESIISKIRDSLHTQSFIEAQASRVYSFNALTDTNETELNESEIWAKIEQNDKISVHFINGRRCFSCGPEIDSLYDQSRQYASENVQLILRFGDNQFFENWPRPDWLMECPVTRMRFDKEYCDMKRCGITSWLVWLARLLINTNPLPQYHNNRRVFVHAFLYSMNYSETIQLLKNYNAYVLPNTCLCCSPNDPLDPVNTHRHVIIVFANHANFEAVRREFIRSDRPNVVPLNGLLPADRTNNIDTTATAKVYNYQMAKQKLKGVYFRSITSPLHFFNTVNYVSREKVDSLYSINQRLQKKRNLNETDLHQSITNLEGRKLNYYYDINPEIETDIDNHLRETEDEPTTTNSTDDPVCSFLDPEYIVKKRREDTSILKNHDANHHVYISRPVCSHFRLLSYMMYDKGLKDMLADNVYNFELIRAILFNLKYACSLVNAGRAKKPVQTKIGFHYITLMDVQRFFSNVNRYHLLPLIEDDSITRSEQYALAWKQLKSYGAALSNSEKNWPIVLADDAFYHHVHVPVTLVQRINELRKFLFVFTNELRDTRRRCIINENRMQVLLSGIEQHYKSAKAIELDLTDAIQNDGDNHDRNGDADAGSSYNQQYQRYYCQEYTNDDPNGHDRTKSVNTSFTSKTDQKIGGQKTNTTTKSKRKKNEPLYPVLAEDLRDTRLKILERERNILQEQLEEMTEKYNATRRQIFELKTKKQPKDTRQFLILPATETAPSVALPLDTPHPAASEKNIKAAYKQQRSQKQQPTVEQRPPNRIQPIAPHPGTPKPYAKYTVTPVLPPMSNVPTPYVLSGGPNHPHAMHILPHGPPLSSLAEGTSNQNRRNRNGHEHNQHTTGQVGQVMLTAIPTQMQTHTTAQIQPQMQTQMMAHIQTPMTNQIPTQTQTSMQSLIQPSIQTTTQTPITTTLYTPMPGQGHWNVPMNISGMQVLHGMQGIQGMQGMQGIPGLQGMHNLQQSTAIQYPISHGAQPLPIPRPIPPPTEPPTQPPRRTLTQPTQLKSASLPISSTSFETKSTTSTLPVSSISSASISTTKSSKTITKSTQMSKQNSQTTFTGATSTVRASTWTPISASTVDNTSSTSDTARPKRATVSRIEPYKTNIRTVKSSNYSISNILNDSSNSSGISIRTPSTTTPRNLLPTIPLIPTDHTIDKTFDLFNRPFDNAIGEPSTLTLVTPSQIQPEKNGTGITMQTSSGDVMWYDSRFETQALCDGSDCKSISSVCIPELDVSNNTTFGETATTTGIIEVALQTDDKGSGTPETTKTKATKIEATEEIQETSKTRETEGITDAHNMIGTEIPSVSQSKYSIPPERPTHAPAVRGPTPPIPVEQEEIYEHCRNIDTHTDDQTNQERDHGYNNQNVGYQSDQTVEKTKMRAGQDVQNERHENEVGDTSQKIQAGNDQIDNQNDEIGLTNTTITNTEISDIDTNDDSIETNFNYQIANKKRTADDSDLDENAESIKRLKPNEN